jgi:hypothetical protein
VHQGETADGQITMRHSIPGNSGNGVAVIGSTIIERPRGRSQTPYQAVNTADGGRRVLVEGALEDIGCCRAPGGGVSVGAFPDNGRATVVVEDTGAGMSAATLARVFEPFYSTKPEGTGIGLAVAQRIVQAHGGSLEITSEEGRGTRVAMSFATINEH